MLDKETLEYYYVVLGKSSRQIAKEFGHSQNYVLNRLRKHEISVRNGGGGVGESNSNWKGTGCIPSKLISKYKARSKSCGRIFNVTADYLNSLFLLQERKCALSGLPLNFDYYGKRKETWNASLDRKDSSIDYLEDNVQWVHKIINMMKGSLTDEQFIYYCGLVYKYAKSKQKTKTTLGGRTRLPQYRLFSLLAGTS